MKSPNRSRSEYSSGLAAGVEPGAIFSVLSEAIVVLDEELYVCGINPSACRLAFPVQGELKGKSLIELFRSSKLISVSRKALELNETVEAVVRLSGSGGVLDVSASPLGSVVIQEDGGKMGRGGRLSGGAGAEAPDGVRGLVLVMRDVTRLKQLEAMRQEFVANVSHQLKTPITAITGFLETLIDGAVHNPDTAQKFLGITLQNARKLNAILDDLLCLSRLEYGSGKHVARRWCSLIGLAERVAAFFETVIAGRNICIRIECESAASALIDDSLVEQALRNLVDNAVKYSPDGAVVTLRVESNGECVRFIVVDEGMGISRLHQERVFERFYRADTEEVRRINGTGLGLSIVKHIAIAHGGSVGLESRPGMGSCFELCLPFV